MSIYIYIDFYSIYIGLGIVYIEKLVFPDVKCIEENSKWIDDGGKFQECRVRGRDGSAIFHAGDEAMSAERERIIPKGIRHLRNCFALPRRKHVGVLSSG